MGPCSGKCGGRLRLSPVIFEGPPLPAVSGSFVLVYIRAIAKSEGPSPNTQTYR